MGFGLILLAALPVFDFATNSIAERVANADPAVCLSRYVDYPPSKGKFGFPRCLFEKPFCVNEKFWLKDVDFSCVSPWNDSCGSLRAGTLISKRHIVCANHFPLWKGVRIVFVDADGGVCPCYVDGTRRVCNTDILVASLNAEVTPTIHPAKILPPDYQQYIGDGAGLPMITFNQHEEAFLTEALNILTNRQEFCEIRGNPSADAHRARFRKRIVSGDSGNPSFMLIGDQPILLSTAHHRGCGSGPPLHLYRREIQKAMDDLCPGYKLEAFDFSKVKLTTSEKGN